MSLIIGIIGSIIAWAICTEIDGWGPKLSRKLLIRAARKLPVDRRDRYFEEWAAHLDELPTSLSQLLVSFGFCFAAVRMRFDADGRAKISLRTQEMTMRAIDVGAVTVAVVVFLPLLLVIALLIYVSSPGPVLFGQPRVGKNGRIFLCYKFRTMHVNAAERLEAYLLAHPAAQAMWEADHRLPHDPRITPLGRFLRKSSLDELPQLFSVLTGTMSLVGPRPIVPAEEVRYGEHLGDYTAVRPGLTGLWQVSGRSETSYRGRVALDVAYSRNRSLRLFLRVLLMTIPAVLMARGGEDDVTQDGSSAAGPESGNEDQAAYLTGHTDGAENAPNEPKP